MDLNRFRDRILALLIMIIGSFVLLLLDSVGVVEGLYNLSSVVSVPFRLELHKVSFKVNDLLGAMGKISALREENDQLRETNDSLLEQLSEFEECKSESEALKEQLKVKKLIQDWMVEARVIGSDISYENSLQINVGTNAGVKEGDIVIFGRYAVGKIIRVGKYTSKVSLISSPESNIPVRGQKNRAVGLVKGEVGLTLKMIDILPDEVVEEGEIIVTSGVDSVYPPGLIIGVVSQVSSNPAYAIQEAKVKVHLDFTKLDYIYVIRGEEV